jgi:phage repressor protein C with HTH and peptisase S24 domain
MLTHGELWSAIDALAARFNMSSSGLAKFSGLDPTSFNRSKRLSNDDQSRERWPSTESLSKLLAATGISFSEFAELAEGGARRRSVPLIGFAQAGDLGFFDDAGFPVGQGWDQLEMPGATEASYALEIMGDSMLPVYREGDRILVERLEGEEPRRGDRVVVKTLDGEVMAKELARITVNRIELKSLNPDYPGRVLERREIAWIARILWASQ